MSRVFHPAHLHILKIGLSNFDERCSFVLAFIDSVDLQKNAIKSNQSCQSFTASPRSLNKIKKNIFSSKKKSSVSAVNCIGAHVDTIIRNTFDFNDKTTTTTTKANEIASGISAFNRGFNLIWFDNLHIDSPVYSINWWMAMNYGAKRRTREKNCLD